eukprot:scaffold4515_cov124-Skeletonema_dohrnii-CCMP3373.AAC.6
MMNTCHTYFFVTQLQLDFNRIFSLGGIRVGTIKNGARKDEGHEHDEMQITHLVCVCLEQNRWPLPALPFILLLSVTGGRQYCKAASSVVVVYAIECRLSESGVNNNLWRREDVAP